jgi:hypothetical protein
LKMPLKWVRVSLNNISIKRSYYSSRSGIVTTGKRWILFMRQ